jgi:hypothetical protein
MRLCVYVCFLLVLLAYAAVVVITLENFYHLLPLLSMRQEANVR